MPCFTSTAWSFSWFFLLFPILGFLMMFFLMRGFGRRSPRYCCTGCLSPNGLEEENQRLKEEISRLRTEHGNRGV